MVLNINMTPIDICFTPLDTISRPNVDIEKFIAWAKSVYPQNDKNHAKDTKATAEGYIKDYPWDIVFGRYNDAWKDGFEIEFPELAKYCYEAFNLKEHELQAMAFLMIRNSVVGNSFWHNDIDLTGFRFYLENVEHENNPLMLRKTRVPYDERVNIAQKSSLDHILDDKEYICKMPDPYCPFYLNNIRSAHSVYVKTPATRIAGFATINPMYYKDVQERNKNFIVNSAIKFKDYAILY